MREAGDRHRPEATDVRPPRLDPALLAHLPPEVALRPARVSRADRGACDVLVAEELRPPAPQRTAWRTVRASWGSAVLAATATDPEAAPVTGDWVVLGDWPDARTTLEAVLPRGPSVTRAQVGRGSSHRQVLAANVDVVAVVEGMAPDPDPGRLERLLALAWSSGAVPAVVLTKADLVADPAALVAEVGSLTPGCAVLPVAAPSGQGVDAVRDLAAGGGTVALVGASGVGKSTLLNALVGAEAMRTRELRLDGKGRHTTVTRELYLMPDRGAVIDTPGLRSVGLVGAENLDDVFADIEQLAEACRFADCAHGVEPGCAVLAAVDAGQLSRRRLDSYRRLQREARYQAARTDARLRAERVARWKAVQKAARARGFRP
ncbi:MAG: ribosome small subunit-dependent GTPase A [Actinomycetota bacterium]